jgi:hypothetical protein
MNTTTNTTVYYPLCAFDIPQERTLALTNYELEAAIALPLRVRTP